MQIQLIPVTMFQSNCVVVWDEQTLDAVVFDPGGEPDRILSFIQTRKLQVRGIFLTHGHVDHVAGANRVSEGTGAPLHMHPADLPVAAAVPRQCLLFGIPLEEAPKKPLEVADGQRFDYGTLAFEAMHTPGHSPGSTCFLFPGPPGVLVCGDLIFAGSIGRTDLGGGDPEAMQASLERARQLPDEVVVISGHGPRTSIGDEKRRNPYLTGGLAVW